MSQPSGTRQYFAVDALPEIGIRQIERNSVNQEHPPLLDQTARLPSVGKRLLIFINTSTAQLAR
jgi:hypothetical protein